LPQLKLLPSRGLALFRGGGRTLGFILRESYGAKEQ
jgi:hypothetical protein